MKQVIYLNWESPILIIEEIEATESLLGFFIAS